MELIYGIAIFTVGMMWGRAHERCTALERRCALLESELMDAQAKLKDEKLILDRRLAIMLTRSGINGRQAVDGIERQSQIR